MRRGKSRKIGKKRLARESANRWEFDLVVLTLLLEDGGTSIDERKCVDIRSFDSRANSLDVTYDCL